MAGIAMVKPRPAAPPHYLQLAQLDRLRRAWRRVWRSNGSFGGDGQTLAQFGEHANDEIERLRLEVMEGRYRPRPLRRCLIPKRGGGERRLLIPSVRDRVVQQAALSVLGPWFEPTFETTSWAYRPGRSHLLALAALRDAWRRGYRWLAESDIEQFFDRIDRARLAALLDESLPDPRLVELLLTWVGGRSGRGVPQGAPVSPLLSNLFLDRFDEEMGMAGRRLFRFGDDFVVATRSAPEAGDAIAAARRIAQELGLRLHPDKTAIRGPEDSLLFLGAELDHGALRWPRRPPMQPIQRRAPKRRGDGWHLYLTNAERGRFRSGLTADPLPEEDGEGGSPPQAIMPDPPRRRPTVPVSALRDLLHCPHAAYRTICLGENPQTVQMRRGSEAHREHASRSAGDHEVEVYSLALGLSGRIDSVEHRGDVNVIVEVKSGRARPPTFADRAQVAAYALALEACNSDARATGELAFTESGRREPIELTPQLITRARLHVRQLHEIADGHWAPPNRRRRACATCRHVSACQGET